MKNNTLAEIVRGLADLAWPNLCLLCERPLIEGETHICMNCLYELPAIHDNSFTENSTAERFLGKIAFVRAAAGFRYQKDSSIQKALELIKYKGEKELGSLLAVNIAHQLLRKGFFEGIDGLVPVPLHKQKLKKRGYNQSEWIAFGIREVTGLPVYSGALGRVIHNSTQTTKNLWKRWENAQGLFEVNKAFDGQGKHFLLVDDVLTSGSTLVACGEALTSLPETSVSFLALALA